MIVVGSTHVMGTGWRPLITAGALVDSGFMLHSTDQHSGLGFRRVGAVVTPYVASVPPQTLLCGRLLLNAKCPA